MILFIPGCQGWLILPGISRNLALSGKLQGSFEMEYGGVKLNIANKAQKFDHLQYLYLTVQFWRSTSFGAIIAENCPPSFTEAVLERGGSTPTSLWFNMVQYHHTLQ